MQERIPLYMAHGHSSRHMNMHEYKVACIFDNQNYQNHRHHVQSGCKVSNN